MSVRIAFQIFAVMILSGVVLMTAALVLVKALRQVHNDRRATLVTEIRPLVLAMLDDDTVAIEFRGRRDAVAASIAISLLPSLRGADRDALTKILCAGGAIDRAQRGLTSASAVRRQRSADMMGAAGVASSGDVVMDLLRDRNAPVRMAAARALGNIGDPRAVVPLLAALDDRLLPANNVSMALVRIGIAGALHLIPALESPSARTRSVAAELVGSFGLTVAAGRLERMLTDHDRSVRRSATRALGRLGAPSSTLPLINLLDTELAKSHRDRDEELAAAAVTALGQIGELSAIPILTTSLSSSHSLSFSAASALGSIGPQQNRRPHGVGVTAEVPLPPAIAILVARSRVAAVA